MTKDREIVLIAGELARTIRHLLHVDQVPLALILPAIHAEIIGCLVGAFGSEAAQSCLDTASEHLRLAHMPESSPREPMQGRAN